MPPEDPVFRVDHKFIRFLSIFLLSIALSAAAQQAALRPASEPLPQDTGAVGLRQMLIRLHTTARLMHTTAHPDDEDGGLLTMHSRGKGANTLLLTLTRGEGGQNKVGSNLFDELGVLRTLELLASDRYYGVEQRFSHVADFGYSKSATETFEKWNGHETALADMVRVIRTFRPDVVFSRFQATKRDGHGHHEACGILTREAFRAAGDPRRFPEQIKEGLQPWQPKKLYVSTRGGEDWTVRYDTGTNDALLGMSYREFAMQGLRHQLSQGADAWRAGPGQYFTSYKLADSVLPSKAAHETDFFEGIDTTLPGLAKRIPEADRKTLSYLAPALNEITKAIEQATSASERDSVSAAEPLLRALLATNELITKVQKSALADSPRADLLANLYTKREQLQEAARLALSMLVEAQIENNGSEFVIPGQRFTVLVRVQAVPGVEITGVRLKVPARWELKPPVQSGDLYRFEVQVPPDAEFTRPYFHREDPETETIYRLDDPELVTLPLTPPPLHAAVRYSYRGLEGMTGAVVNATLMRNGGRVGSVPVAVAPAISALIEPATRVIPASQREPAEVLVRVRSNVANLKDAVLALHAEPGWRVTPATQNVEIAERGGERTLKFYLFPSGAQEGKYRLRAIIQYNGQDYDQGYSRVTREDLATAYYYQPATQRVSVVNVNTPPNLRVGYITGAGDDIPRVIQQLGMNVKMITPEELAGGDLQQYGTIVLGIRAYDTREDVRKHNQRLLDYCSRGGSLVVQYNASTSEFNAGKFTPYPSELGRDRVSVEEAPVEVLDPGDDVFDFPNEITAKDFQRWVQERGLYFMHSWEGRFRPLLASQDPGEEPLRGGLLRAPYGKGTYIYTGYSFFRQLPNGVPGAIRLFVNIVAAGHEDGR